MTNGTEDQSGDGCGRSNHTVQPLCDLESNWAVDLAKNLEEYLLKICSGDISGDNDSHLSVNFAEVFLVSFREAQTQTCFEVLTDFCLTSYWKPLMQAEASSDLSQTKEKEQADRESHVEPKKSRKHAKHFLDSEFGVLRGIDFKNVHTVINFEMPKSASGYVHRIGRTGRAYNTGASVSLVSPDEMKTFEEIKSILGDDENKDSNFIAPFPLLTKNAVESLRYRAQGGAKYTKD